MQCLTRVRRALDRHVNVAAISPRTAVPPMPSCTAIASSAPASRGLVGTARAPAVSSIVAGSAGLAVDPAESITAAAHDAELLDGGCRNEREIVNCIPPNSKSEHV